MSHQTFAAFDSPQEQFQPHLALESEPTQTIDLKGLFAPDLSASGVYDLRSIGATALGKLLEAIPIPIMLIDKWFFVAYANKAFSKISEDYKEIQGSRFIDVLPAPDDEQRARLLTEKTMALLERVFADRKPLQAEAILEIGERRIWARLHLRSIRVNSDRHIMVIIEDVTAERSQQRISERDEKRFRLAAQQMKLRIRELNEELAEAREQLAREVKEHAKTRAALKDCLE